jgi:hypothetical protein
MVEERLHEAALERRRVRPGVDPRARARLSPSSDIAQRSANAMLWILEQGVDAEEAALFELDTIPVLRTVLAALQALGPSEARLWSACVYADDKLIEVIGAPARSAY